jgi:hypothetical protein
MERNPDDSARPEQVRNTTTTPRRTPKATSRRVSERVPASPDRDPYRGLGSAQPCLEALQLGPHLGRKAIAEPVEVLLDLRQLRAQLLGVDREQLVERLA